MNTQSNQENPKWYTQEWNQNKKLKGVKMLWFVRYLIRIIRMNLKGAGKKISLQGRSPCQPPVSGPGCTILSMHFSNYYKIYSISFAWYGTFRFFSRIWKESINYIARELRISLIVGAIYTARTNCDHVP
jgi:hypothetical protein